MIENSYETDFWVAIQQRLHEESGLLYPRNIVKGILEAYVNGSLNDFQSVRDDLFFEGFLLTCQGIYLDKRGHECGLERDDDETDEEFRQRIFNSLSNYLSVNYLKQQGILLYSTDDVDDNIRETMTSNNPYVSNKYIAIPRNNSNQNFIEDDIVYEKIIQVYTRGW